MLHTGGDTGNMEAQGNERYRVDEEAAGEIRGLMCDKSMKDRKEREGEKSGWKVKAMKVTTWRRDGVRVQTVSGRRRTRRGIHLQLL